MDYYLAERVQREDGLHNKILRLATPEEIKTFLAARQQAKDMSIMACSNPYCDKLVPVPRAQKHKFLTTYPLRYGRFIQVYCSEECQRIHSKELAGIQGQGANSARS